MIRIKEGRLEFAFQTGCATQYDQWAFYRRQFQGIARGSKAVDFLCLDGNIAWLIEVTDYRSHTGEQERHTMPKPRAIAGEVAEKVRDTLAGLAAACKNANNSKEKSLARKSIRKARWRVVLHLEQPRAQTPRRRTAIDPRSIESELGRLLKAVDPHPKVMDCRSGYPVVPWTVK